MMFPKVITVLEKEGSIMKSKQKLISLTQDLLLFVIVHPSMQAGVGLG